MQNRNASTQVRRKSWKSAPAGLLVTLLMIAPFSIPAVSTAADALVVPEGSTLVVGQWLRVSELTVLGTLRTDAVGLWHIEAAHVRVGSAGVIQAPAGLDGADAEGLDATGGHGADGGSILLQARALTVEEGGRILAGSGGHGGHADGHGIVTGGNGGRGGSVVVEAATTDLGGGIAAGSGGAGGWAIQERFQGSTLDIGPDAIAIGGHGGDAGLTLLNGAPVLPPVNAKFPPQFRENMDPAVIPACPVPPPVVGSEGLHGFGGAGGPACMIFFGDDGVPGAGCGNAGTPGQSATANARAGNGGHGLAASNGGVAGWAWAGARGGRGGDGGDCNTAFVAAGAGSSGGGATATATAGVGGDSSPFGGDGGLGGTAKAAAKGGRGGDGGTATSGAGGAGGNGGGSKGTAVAGGGGDASGVAGDVGGDGGDAFVWSEGGDGGNGGGGTPVGGPGGDGGQLSIADATSGQGGAGAPPGATGDAETTVDPEGGDAGPNMPGGNGGNWIISAISPPGGTGCAGYPGGPGGDARHNVPPGTGQGGAGTPPGQDGKELLRIERDGPPGRTGGPECREVTPITEVHGVPDTTCEDTASEWADHEYGPPATGLTIQGFQESNMEDCDGDFNPTDPFCLAEEVAREDVDGDTDVCEAFDNDGHSEYTRGGAWLLVNSGDGVTGGTVLCFGEVGHHPNFGPVTVADVTYGQTVPFTVEADLVDATGLGDPCGDFQSDVSTSCVGTCTVTYPAGLDGSYQVFVGFGFPGTQGHVCTPGGDCDLSSPGGDPIAGTLQCIDFADNDSDDGPGPAGGKDWIDVLGLVEGSGRNDDEGCNEGIAGTFILDGDGEL